MGKTTRKRYGAEFKAKVALEAIRGELTIAQLVAKHGVHQTMINAWKKQATEGLARADHGKKRDPCRWMTSEVPACDLAAEWQTCAATTVTRMGGDAHPCAAPVVGSWPATRA